MSEVDSSWCSIYNHKTANASKLLPFCQNEYTQVKVGFRHSDPDSEADRIQVRLLTERIHMQR
jgi:hypothetical protein